MNFMHGPYGACIKFDECALGSVHKFLHALSAHENWNKDW